MKSAAVVVADVNFEVPSGSVTAVLEPSGCGKTSLLRAVIGIQRGVSGRVEVLGRSPAAPVLRPLVG
ncbi:ATP-binding cassette domain-containing protein [Streptomyces sp. NPDC001852]